MADKPQEGGVQFSLDSSPAALVAVAKAAHVTGDRDLERAARRLLEAEHGIGITFKRPGPGGK